MNWSSPEDTDGLTALMELVVPFLVMKRSQQSFLRKELQEWRRTSALEKQEEHQQSSLYG
jgi:hypothetical protein